MPVTSQFSISAFERFTLLIFEPLRLMSVNFASDISTSVNCASCRQTSLNLDCERSEFETIKACLVSWM